MAARMRKQSDSKFFSPVEEKVSCDHSLVNFKVREVPKEQSTKSKKKRVIEEEDIENIDPSPNEESIKPIQKEKGNKMPKKSQRDAVEEQEATKQKSEVKEKKSAPVKEIAKANEEREPERVKKTGSVSQVIDQIQVITRRSINA